MRMPIHIFIYIYILVYFFIYIYIYIHLLDNSFQFDDLNPIREGRPERAHLAIIHVDVAWWEPLASTPWVPLGETKQNRTNPTK